MDSANANNLGQYIPVAVPDTTTYPGSDYYEIEIGQVREQVHSDLPPLQAGNRGHLFREYRQTNARDRNGNLIPEVNHSIFWDPSSLSRKTIRCASSLPISLPTGEAGDLFVPVDTTVMGSGEFEINFDPETKMPIPYDVGGLYAESGDHPSSWRSYPMDQ